MRCFFSGKLLNRSFIVCLFILSSLLACDQFAVFIYYLLELSFIFSPPFSGPSLSAALLSAAWHGGQVQGPRVPDIFKIY